MSLCSDVDSFLSLYFLISSVPSEGNLCLCFLEVQHPIEGGHGLLASLSQTFIALQLTE